MDLVLAFGLIRTTDLFENVRQTRRGRSQNFVGVSGGLNKHHTENSGHDETGSLGAFASCHRDPTSVDSVQSHEQTFGALRLGHHRIRVLNFDGLFYAPLEITTS